MIEFKNVTKKYGNGTITLDNVNFAIEGGSLVYLIGPTGSGKTTIFRMIIRDVSPSEGEITLGEWNLSDLPKSKTSQLRRKVGVIFQDLKLLLDRTIRENVMLPLLFSGVSESEAKARAEEILAEVGLAGKEEQFPVQLSGGEKQRVAIARALVFDPEIILADEPTGNLDMATSFQIVDLLRSINKKGTTIFMATHNDKIIEKSDDRVIVLEKGKIIEDRKSKNKKVEEIKKPESYEGETRHNDEKEAKEEKKSEEKEYKDDEKDTGREKIKLATLAHSKGGNKR